MHILSWPYPGYDPWSLFSPMTFSYPSQCIFSFIFFVSACVKDTFQSCDLVFQAFSFPAQIPLISQVVFKHWPSLLIWTLDYGFASICPVCLSSSPSVDYGSVATSQLLGARVTGCVKVHIRAVQYDPNLISQYRKFHIETMIPITI